MYVCDTNRKWIDTPFFRQKFLIKTQDELNTLLEYCQYFFIDTHKGCDVATTSPSTPQNLTDTSQPGESTTDTQASCNPYSETYIHCINALELFFDRAKHQLPLDIGIAQDITQQLMAGVMASCSDMIALCRIAIPHKELSKKSVDVCILACALGWHLNLSTAELLQLGMGALLHDIGIIRIPDAILRKVEPLTLEERNAMEKHVEYGLAMLVSVANMPKQVLKMVYHHHERFDGKGYPKGLSLDDNELPVQIVGLCSVYTALTQDRADRKSLTPESALQFIYQSGNTLFDPALVERFIELLGVYPSGCVVELSGGELALITRVNASAPLRPAVLLLTDSEKNLLDNRILLDLSDPEQAKLSIRGTLSSDEPALAFLQLLNQTD